MAIDRKIEQLIAIGVKSLALTKKEYQNLKPETKKLIKLNDIKVIFKD